MAARYGRPLSQEQPFSASLLGQRLRATRARLGWSLKETERRSSGRFTHQAIGSYERGDRALKAITLHELADLYGVSGADLMPGADLIPSPLASAAAPRLVLDLPAVSELPATESPLHSFIRQITTIRGDYGGKMLSIRHTDVDILAAMYGCSAAEVTTRLHAIEALRPVD